MEMINNKFKRNIMDEIPQVKEFLEIICDEEFYILINEDDKQKVDLDWISYNINMNLDDIRNIRYINDKHGIEIKYRNKDVIKLFADL